MSAIGTTLPFAALQHYVGCWGVQRTQRGRGLWAAHDPGHCRWVLANRQPCSFVVLPHYQHGITGYAFPVVAAVGIPGQVQRGGIMYLGLILGTDATDLSVSEYGPNHVENGQRRSNSLESASTRSGQSPAIAVPHRLVVRHRPLRAIAEFW